MSDSCSEALFGGGAAPYRRHGLRTVQYRAPLLGRVSLILFDDCPILQMRSPHLGENPLARVSYRHPFNRLPSATTCAREHFTMLAALRIREHIQPRIMALNEAADAATEPHSTSVELSSTAADPNLDQARLDLVALLDRFTTHVEGTAKTEVQGLSLHRITCAGGPSHGIQTPALGLIAQGTKRVMVGDEVYVYDPMHYLVSSVDLPVMGQVTGASVEQPYLGLRLDLEVEEIAALIRDESLPPATHADATRGLYVNRLGTPMLDAVLRLLRLLDTPDDIPILAPLIKREILYRLLMNGPGARLRQIALHDSQTQRIAKAILLLRENFTQPLRVEAIARDVHMSVSSLHHHFKAVTAMSPLQYQKQLRLQEARRLMLIDMTDAATAAHRVGYESASQFSREYSRLFGAPPVRDTRRWRDSVGA